jgi:hypothetical protein
MWLGPPVPPALLEPLGRQDPQAPQGKLVRRDLLVLRVPLAQPARRGRWGLQDQQALQGLLAQQDLRGRQDQ